MQAKSSGKAANRKIAGFLIGFAVLMIVFEVIYQGFLLENPIFEPWLKLNAKISGLLLQVLGEDISILGTRLFSPRSGVDIRAGCDAVEPIALFSFAALAFPVAWSRRFKVVGLGLIALLALNQVRIVSLYYFQIHSTELFDAAHIFIWPMFFIAVAAGMWAFWAAGAWKAQLAASQTPASSSKEQ